MAAAGVRIEENRSRFQACGGPCRSPDEALPLVALLTGTFRLGRATQLSWAARIGGRPVTEIRDDGGESGASRCILDVMRAAGAVDCLVLVARWFGGRHLGGARFRMYTGLTAKLLRESGQAP